MEAEGSDEDKIIVRSNGTVTYTGKDIAYQLWKLGVLPRDFRYRLHSRYADGAPVWTTTSGDGEPGAPPFKGARAVYNVIDTGQSYPQRVVKAGVAALGHREAADESHHLAYEKVVLSPATARTLGYDVSEDESAVKVSGRKGLGVKGDDLIDALLAKARAEIEATGPRNTEATSERRRRRPRPSPREPFGTSCSASPAPASSRSTWTKPSHSWGRRAPTSRMPLSVPRTSLPRCRPRDTTSRHCCARRQPST